jgi:16S rRNA (uracil1498-N3)-methyltransferase
MSAPRFYVEELPAPGEIGSLSPTASHHASAVLHLQPGDHLYVFDGRTLEFAARVESIGRGAVRFRLEQPLPACQDSPLRIALAIPPLKGNRFDLVIEKATELGVAEIIPLRTTRSEPFAHRDVAGQRRARWVRIAISAAEQCGRTTLPVVTDLHDLRQVLDGQHADLRLALDASCELTFRALDAEVQRRAPQAALVLVGPAGGWTPHESTLIREASVTPVRCGPRTLRSETAAIAALALLQALWGDLGPATSLPPLPPLPERR